MKRCHGHGGASESSLHEYNRNVIVVTEVFSVYHIDKAHRKEDECR